MKLVKFSMEVTVKKSDSGLGGEGGDTTLMSLGKKTVPLDNPLRKRIGVPVHHPTSHPKIHRNNGKYF